jgi:hypothetical protein
MAQAVSRWPPHRGAPGQSMWDLWWTKWHWDRFFPEYFPLSVSFHRCSTTWKRTKNNHLHHSVALKALRLRSVRSVCCRALHWKKNRRNNSKCYSSTKLHIRYYQSYRRDNLKLRLQVLLTLNIKASNHALKACSGGKCFDPHSSHIIPAENPLSPLNWGLDCRDGTNMAVKRSLVTTDKWVTLANNSVIYLWIQLSLLPQVSGSDVKSVLTPLLPLRHSSNNTTCWRNV